MIASMFTLQKPRRPDQGEAALHLAVHHRHPDSFRPPGADEMRFGHYRPGVGHAEVDPLHVLDGDQVRLVFVYAFDIQQTLFEHLVLRIEQALFAFRVGGADSPVIGRKKDETGFVFGTQHGS
jgi:hypothetical protein